MPMLEALNEWDDVTLEADEFWQCRSGRVLVTVEAEPTANVGVFLAAGESIDFPSGATVNFRGIGTGAQIWREVRAVPE